MPKVVLKIHFISLGGALQAALQNAFSILEVSVSFDIKCFKSFETVIILFCKFWYISIRTM